jgi:predicted transcriptional regulator
MHFKSRLDVDSIGKRAWADIIADILLSTKDGENITDVMYKSRLSYGRLKDYLKLLVDNGLLDYDKKSGGTYTTTKKGIEYIATYKRVRNFVFPTE